MMGLMFEGSVNEFHKEQVQSEDDEECEEMLWVIRDYWLGPSRRGKGNSHIVWNDASSNLLVNSECLTKLNPVPLVVLHSKLTDFSLC